MAAMVEAREDQRSEGKILAKFLDFAKTELEKRKHLINRLETKGVNVEQLLDIKVRT